MEAVGLDVEHGLDLIGAGVVPRLLDYKGRALMKRDYNPRTRIDLMCKDPRLAAEELPPARLGSLARAIMDQASREGHGTEDPAAIMRIIERQVTS